MRARRYSTSTMTGEGGPLVPRRFADLFAFRTDPLTCPTGDLWTLKPALTLVAGRAAFDPDGLLAV
jgi:hypothetical protein